MSTKTIQMTPALSTYLQTVGLREAAILTQLRAKTAQMTGAQMQISPEQGQFMAMLVTLLGAKKTIDIGTFTGYSALVVALALPDDGNVITCDINKQATDIAKRFWCNAHMENKIDLRLAPAVETLQQLMAAGEANTFDFIFIDADKNNYAAYYELSLQLVRPGGLIAIDNVLWNGRVADPAINDEATLSIRALNAKIHDDERVMMSLVPIGDGLTLVRKNLTDHVDHRLAKEGNKLDIKEEQEMADEDLRKDYF